MAEMCSTSVAMDFGPYHPKFKINLFSHIALLMDIIKTRQASLNQTRSIFALSALPIPDQSFQPLQAKREGLAKLKEFPD